MKTAADRRRLGVSAAVLAILLVIIAISLASIVWVFVSTQTQSLARSSRLDIVDAKLLVATGGNTMMVSVKNTGSIVLNNVRVTSPASATIAPQLRPGDTASWAGAVAGTFTPGDKVNVIVQAATPDGQNIYAITQVIVQ